MDTIPNVMTPFQIARAIGATSRLRDSTHQRKFRAKSAVPEGGLEPPRVAPRAFETRASTIPPPRQAAGHSNCLLAGGAPALEVVHQAAAQARRRGAAARQAD